MQRTTNYGLCQYEGSDKTSYLVNYNDDMLKIDTAIKNAADAGSGAGTAAEQAQSTADGAARDVSTLNTQINGANGLAANVSTLQGSVNTINSLIGNGEPTTTDKTLIGAINELDSDTGEITNYLGDNCTIVHFSQTITKTADGVKTWKQLLEEALADFKAVVDARTNHYFELIHVVTDGYISKNAGMNVYAPNQSISAVFHGTNISANLATIDIRDLEVANAEISAYDRAVITAADGTISVSDMMATVPTSGKTAVIRYREYAVK